MTGLEHVWNYRNDFVSDTLNGRDGEACRATVTFTRRRKDSMMIMHRYMKILPSIEAQHSVVYDMLK